MKLLSYLLYCLMLYTQINDTVQQNWNTNQFETDCGCRLARREPRNKKSATSALSFSPPQQRRNSREPRIIAGTTTKEGQFPWQASLELLHPSLGFLGHWCGGVLIHKYWVLSAAHCVHNDLFNLPIPPLWTVVLGEHNRLVETGYEQRIPVEKIVLHKSYQNFLHDLVLMKLSRPADLSKSTAVRRICLPFMYDEDTDSEAGIYEEDMPSDVTQMYLEEESDSDLDALEPGLATLSEKMDNFLRSAQKRRTYQNISLPSMKELMSTKILQRLKKVQAQLQQAHAQTHLQRRGKYMRLTRRRNDKLMKIRDYNEYNNNNNNEDDDDMTAADDDEQQYAGLIEQKHRHDSDAYKDLPFIDCIATGWGKANVTGDLTDLLLKTSVPLHNNKRCREAYGSFVKIHRGHLCAGKLNGKGGTCVGDSGGPLQCRLTKNGPWILAGITSFGSGCAIEGYPDVYTRTSHYMKWIQNTIAYS